MRDSSLPEGTNISHYRILSLLGSGGMGEVYLAEDTRLDRKVALKLLPAEFTKDENRLRRFIQEAKAASALNHPHIVTVYDIGESDAGHFIVMEFVQGRTLGTMIGEPCSMDSLAGLGIQITKALGATHAAGITHRDIKPDNIMLRDDGYLKMLDFGLARLVPTAFDEEAETLRGTMPGTFIGTARYMSPEQARSETVTSATDIFALGIVFYELAAAQHPFHADSVLGVLHSIAAEPPVPPSRLNPEIPSGLEALILQMLEKDPRLRPRASEVEAALTELCGKPLSLAVSSRPISVLPTRNTVGRQKERSELLAGFASANEGRGLLLAVAGEPGMGKTTLIEDFLSDLAANNNSGLIARGRFSERLAGAEAYLALLEALDSLLHGPAADFIVRTMKALAPTWYLQIAPLSAESSSSVRVMAEAQAVSQERMKRELLAFLQEASNHRPVILVFDDLHWADASTIDMISYLATKLVTMRVLIVATYRLSEMLLNKHPFLPVKLDLQGHGVCQELQLDLLSSADVECYLALEFPEHRFSNDFVNLIYAKTEGNPLFMVDLVRYLRGRKVISEKNGHWVLAESLPDVERELPESVRSMIERKVAQLSDEDRRLLIAASVQGYEFDSAVLAKAAGIDAADVEERLEELERVYSFVRLVNEGEFPDRTLTLRYRFVHALYQNALYGSLRPTRKAQLSAAVAGALKGYYGEKSRAVASELASLYESARDYGQASDYYRLAAQNAGRVFAQAEAAVLSRRGLEMLKALPDSEERARKELKLQISLGFSLMTIKGYGALEVKQPYLRARELGQQLNDSKQLFQVYFGLSIVEVVRAEYEEARIDAEQCLRLAENAEDPMLLVQAHWVLALSLQHLGEFVSASEHLATSIELYKFKPNSNILLYGAIINRVHLARLQLYCGYPEQAQELVDEALIMVKKTRHPIGPANTFSIAAFIDVLRRRPQKVQEWADALTLCAEEHGLPYYAAIGAIMRGWALIIQGAEPDTIAVMRNGLAACRATGTEQHRSSYLVLLADALGAAGQIEQGLEALNEAIEVVARTGEHFYEAELYRIKGELLIKSFPHAAEEAESCFHRAIDIARQQSAKLFELRAVISLSCLWQQQGKRSEARKMLGELYDWFTEGFETADLKHARSLLEEWS